MIPFVLWTFNLADRSIVTRYGFGESDNVCCRNKANRRQLHKALVSPMNPRARLTVLFDCCHSGSAIELPFVYRPNAAGQVNLIDNVKQGISLASAAANLLHGGFSASKMQEAKALIGGAHSFFASLHHRPDGPVDQNGLGEEKFVEDWKHEGKDVWMFSGCADNQTSADTSIAGAATGAMSYGFIATMRQNPNQSYIEVSSSTRPNNLSATYADGFTGPSEHPTALGAALPTDSPIICWRTIRLTPESFCMFIPIWF
jgi:hypothetical protein